MSAVPLLLSFHSRKFVIAHFVLETSAYVKHAWASQEELYVMHDVCMV